MRRIGPHRPYIASPKRASEDNSAGAEFACWGWAADSSSLTRCMELGHGRGDFSGGFQGGGEFDDVGGFGQEVVGSGFEAFEAVFPEILHRHEDHMRVEGVFSRPDASAEFRSVHFRHHPVGDDDLLVLGVEVLPGLAPFLRHHDPLPRLLKPARVGW